LPAGVDAAAPPLSERVELFFSCSGLPNMDTFSLSDPFIVAYSADPRRTRWTEIFRTETIDNNLNPV
jgi:hypothetical protein